MRKKFHKRNSKYGLKGSNINGIEIDLKFVSNNNIDGFHFTGKGEFVAIACNQITENTWYGINIQAGTGLNIMNNNFIYNNLTGTSQAFDAGESNRIKGNHWIDRTGTGSYKIDGGKNSDSTPVSTEISFDIGWCGGVVPNRPTDIFPLSSNPTSFVSISIVYLAL
jgi:hypothetical protein